jgi:hypothetical protein
VVYMNTSSESESELVVEGPYWDYSGAADYAKRQCAVFSELAAESLLDGNLPRARKFAAKYADAAALRVRVTARYDATKDDDALLNIGWRASLSRYYY